MASVNNGGEDDTHHLFEHDPVFNEGPWDVHRVSKMDVVIRGAVHLQTKDGDVGVDDVDHDDDDEQDGRVTLQTNQINWRIMLTGSWWSDI